MNTNRDDNAETLPDAAKAGEGRACPACGALARREEARYCAVCGRVFDGGGYLPSDALRSSYHDQRRTPPVTKSNRITPAHPPVMASQRQRPSLHASAVSVASSRRVARARMAAAAMVMPLEKKSNGAATTSLAFVAYALVPYLGILFCPGALVMGGFGYVRALRVPERGGRRDSLLGILLGLLILAAQLFLWWLLYKVPEWSRGNL